MAKKIVRGITDVKTINNQDFDTNNVNDLLSDGQYNYIHRKKGKNEEYHNLTDNIKTISSDNTELLSVTNNNKTTNTATLHPKHDAQKEQLLESTRNTIAINHGTNGTDEKTTVDTNPKKVLEHENLLTINGISKLTEGNLTTIGLKTIDNYSGDLNELTYTCLAKPVDNATNLPTGTLPHGILKVVRMSDVVSQQYHTYNNILYMRSCKKAYSTPEWTPWVKVVDKSTIDALLVQKQDVLTAGTGITIQGNTISATGDGSTSTIQFFSDTNFKAYGHRVETSEGTLLTLSFECYNAAETVLTGDLKYILDVYVKPNKSISNGALTISYDGTTMKLINSAPSENVNQHATFTFNGNVVS